MGIRASCGPCSCDCQWSRPQNCKEDPRGAGDDRDQLVHVPNCLFVPNVRLLSSEGSCVHPSGLLYFGHYFQMWSRLGHLPDLLRQVWQEGSLAISMSLRCRAWRDFARFSSRTDTLFLSLMSFRWFGQQQVTEKKKKKS